MRQIKHLFIFSALVLLMGFSFSNFLGIYHQTILALCGINIILAVSLNLVNGFTGQFSLGHAGFMAVGAYVSAALTTLWLPTLTNPFLMTEIGVNLFFLFALLAGGIAAGLTGFLVGVPSLRLKGDYLAVVTLGFGEIIRIFILNIEPIGGARGLIGIPQLSNLYWIFGFVLLICIWIHRIVSSIPGKQFMAVRDDETATSAMGLSTTRIKVRSFVYASFFAGIAGGLFAHYIAYLNPATFNFNYSFQIVAMVVLGGMGSLTGSVAAAILLTGLLEALRPLQDLTGVDLRMVIYALTLIVLMLTRPEGMFGRHEIWEFFKKFKKSPQGFVR
ncbi:MAG: branched-chain amino acid ABC transporter permease [Deltaproteobacteria bacterium]|nr:branched-chain amino acid ABC transporter permease [Deltaproteobacteria bacterium]